MMELLVAGTIVACFLGIGIAVESAARDSDTVDWSAPSGWLVHGWAVLCSVGVIAALGGAKLRELLTVAALFGVGGLLALGTTNKSRRSALLALLLATILVGPLLWITSQTPATIFDEFGQWLPNARFLYENDSFPTASDPNVWSGKPGYPPGVPLTILAGSELLGEIADRIAKILVIIIAIAFGLALADLLSVRMGRCLALVVGVGIATVLNPFFDPRIALTAYADTPSAFILGLIVLAAWTYLKQPNTVSGCRVATCAVVLVLLRDTNSVLLAGVVVGLLVFAWSQRTMQPVPIGRPYHNSRGTAVCSLEDLPGCCEHPACYDGSSSRILGLVRTNHCIACPCARSPHGEPNSRQRRCPVRYVDGSASEASSSLCQPRPGATLLYH